MDSDYDFEEEISPSQQVEQTIARVLDGEPAPVAEETAAAAAAAAANPRAPAVEPAKTNRKRGGGSGSSSSSKTPKAKLPKVC